MKTVFILILEFDINGSSFHRINYGVYPAINHQKYIFYNPNSFHFYRQLGHQIT